MKSDILQQSVNSTLFRRSLASDLRCRRDFNGVICLAAFFRMYVLKESGKSRRSPSSSELLLSKLKSSSSSENTNACSSFPPPVDSLSLLFSSLLFIWPFLVDPFLFFFRSFLSIFFIFTGSSTLILTGFPSQPKAPPTIILLSFDWSVMHIAGPSVRSSGSLHDSGMWPSLSQRLMHCRQ